MKIDLTKKILTLDGAEMPTSQDGGKTSMPLTLGVACVEALLRPAGPQDAQDSPMQKMEAYELARKMHKQSEVDLTPEQVVMLRTKLHLAWPQPLIAAQAVKMLDS